MDYYEILGVGRSASAAEIKAAYRAAVKTAHPDRGGDAHLFAALTEAFDVLSDPKEREFFDQHGQRRPKIRPEAIRDVVIPIVNAYAQESSDIFSNTPFQIVARELIGKARRDGAAELQDIARQLARLRALRVKAATDQAKITPVVEAVERVIKILEENRATIVNALEAVQYVEDVIASCHFEAVP